MGAASERPMRSQTDRATRRLPQHGHLLSDTGAWVQAVMWWLCAGDEAAGLQGCLGVWLRGRWHAVQHPSAATSRMQARAASAGYVSLVVRLGWGLACGAVGGNWHGTRKARNDSRRLLDIPCQRASSSRLHCFWPPHRFVVPWQTHTH